MSGTQTDRPIAGEVAADISNAVVRLLADYTGRGPTKARTYLNGDLISVVLQDTLTKGERSLLREGDEAIVLQTRKAFQNAMKDDLVRVVEQHSGRRVLAFLSDNHLNPDVAVESFVLEPSANGHAGASMDRA